MNNTATYTDLDPDGLISSAKTGLFSASGERMRKYVAIYVSLAVFFLSAFGDVLNGFDGIAVLTVALLVGLPGAGRSSLPSTLAFTGIAIFTMPYIGIVYMNIVVQTAWFALYIITAIILVEFGEPVVASAALPKGSLFDLPLIAVFLVAGLLFWGDEGLRQVSFYAGWAIALVHLERIHAYSRSLIYRGIALFAFVAVIGYFTTVLWAGGGRIVQLSFALAPILMTIHYRSFRVNALIIAAVAAGLSFAGRLLRFGWSDGISGLAEDSGASPITITSYLWQTNDAVLERGSIVEQWTLLFVNWFPRGLWPEKPLGVGATFVDLVVGRQGVSAEHNLAIGFFGEHIFFLPNAWILSVTLLVVVLIVMRRSIGRLCAPYRAPLIIFDVWLITIFWGGMAAFAARAWLALIPVIPYLLLIKFLDARTVAAGSRQPV